MRRNYLKLLFLLCPFLFFAQSGSLQNGLQEFCHEQEVLEKMRISDTQAYAEYRKASALTAKEVAANSTKQAGTVYIIPVVFHILHDNGVSNISNAQITDALNIMNRDFRKLNADANTVHSDFLSRASDAEIEFRFATVAPDGTCFGGITRTVATSSSSDGLDQVNQVIAGNNVYQGLWPHTKYLNIIVAANIGGAAGYTYRPFSSASATASNMRYNSIFILQNYVGSTGTASTSRSRALTHEIGHWLDLLHTWGSGNYGVNCSGDDLVADTPATIGSTTCNLNENSCGSRANVENYMDYAYCFKMFTTGQVNRMRAAIQSTTGGRNQIWTQANLNATGAGVPQSLCPAKISNVSTACQGKGISFSVINSGITITSYSWSFPGGSPSTSTSASPTVTYSTAGTATATVTVNSSQGSKTMTSSVTVQAAPSAPTASAQSFCGSATVADLTGTGANLKWYSAATGGTALASTATLATGTYYLSQTTNSCESARTSVNVTVNAVPAAPTASPQSFCGSATVADLTGTGANLKWYSAATGGTALASTATLATGTYYLSQTTNSCESARTSVNVTVNAVPAAPAASSQSFCGSATVAALTGTGTNLKWYSAATGGTPLASTAALATGPYYLSQTTNACESARTSVNVTVNAVPAAPTASSQSFCGTATVADLTGTGTNLKWYSAAIGGTPLASTAALATGTYYLSQTTNSCESARTSVNVTVNAVPAAPAASAQSFCGTATVANLTGTGTNLKWYSAATGGTALASTATLATGTYYLSQTTNSCESARTSVNVTVNAVPSAPAASSQSFCGSATVADLTGTGTNLKWYSAATGGTPLASTAALATGTYYLSQTTNSCESARTSVNVTVNAVPAAPAASAQSFCGTATIADLTGTGTNLKWYSAATGGTALASTAALATGTYYLSQTTNSCESARTSVNVTVNAVPAAPAASAQSFCGSAKVTDLTGTGTNLKWYSAATGGTALASTAALATGTYYLSQTTNSCESARTSVNVTVNAVPAAPAASAQSFCGTATVANLTGTGTNLRWYSTATGGTPLASTAALATGTYYLSQTTNSCESARTSVNVTVNAVPAAPTASAQSFCGTATVADLTGTGTNLKWYSAATGGTALASTATLATGTYYLSQTTNSCESARTSVNITVNAVPAAPAASAQSFCGSATVADLTGTGTNLKWYSAATGGTALASTAALATGTYYLSQTTNSCESARTSVNVTVNAVPPTPTASSQSFCGTATVADLTGTGTNLKWYSAATGGTPLASTAALATGTYYLSQTTNSCESARTSVNVTVNAVPAAPTASSQSFCGSATVAALTGTGANLKWYSAATGGTPLASTAALATGTYYLSQTTNSCESARTSVNVTVTTINSTVTMTTNTLTANQNNATYQWYNCSGTAVPAATGQSFMPATSGSYKVRITMNNCTVDSACQDIAVLGTAEAAPDSTLKVYPIPASTEVFIETGSLTQVSVSIIDSAGRIISTNQLKKGVNRIDISLLPSATYILKINSREGQFVRKLLK